MSFYVVAGDIIGSMTIFDYVKYYKDVKLSEVGWNQMDTLLVAILSYAKIRGFRDKRSFAEFINRVENVPKEKGEDMMAPAIRRMAKTLKRSKRYERVTVENFNDVLNDKTQFGAMTWNVGREKVIGFRGTDGTIIGWIESLRLSYEYPTKTHLLARRYLEKSIEEGDNVILCGHSKGGNLAVVGAMGLDEKKQRAVKKIYNFDGPGVRDKQFKSREYGMVRYKIENILPEKSYVGTLMLSGGKTKIVKSNAKGLAVHYPVTWEVFGEVFVKGRQDKGSLLLHENTVANFMKIDEKKVEKVLAVMFEKLEGRVTSKMSWLDVLSVVEGIRGMDAETKKGFNSIIESLLRKTS